MAAASFKSQLSALHFLQDQAGIMSNSLDF